MIKDVTSAGAMPVLEAALRFAGGRQRLLAHNIANISTPNFQPKDVSTSGFQELLSDAIDARRGRNGGVSGELNLRGSREVNQRANGRLELTPTTGSGNVLFHDRNSRDLERSMQAMVENATYFRAASDFMRQQKDLLLLAIQERV